MASLLLAAGTGVYYKVKDTKAKHKAARDAHNSLRFSELEKENTERIHRLSQLPQAQSIQAQPHAGSTDFASNNPFRDATSEPTTQHMSSNTNNPFDSTENLGVEGRRGSSDVEEEVEEMRQSPRYEGVAVGEKKKKRRLWGRNRKLGSLRPEGWGGKKEDGVVR